jgi:hypothetical protein
MGLLSKWLGIDARRNAENEAKKQAEATAKAAADAQKLQEQVAAQQKQYQDAMQNMQHENGVLNAANQELSTDTVSNVVAGGTADSMDASVLKRKRVSTGIAASLGINI